MVQVTALFDKLALTTHLQDLDIEAIGDGEVMKGVSPSLFSRVIFYGILEMTVLSYFRDSFVI